MKNERTVVGIKPDAFSPWSEREKGSELRVPLPKNPQDFIDELVEGLMWEWLQIIDQHSKICSEELAREHYAEFADSFSEDYGENKQDFLAKYMTSGTSYWLLCEWPEAVKKWRNAIAGIREKYLLTPWKARYNMTHWSGNIEEANIEEELHFNNRSMIFWLAYAFFASQVLAGIAIIADVCSFQFKERKKIILLFIVAASCIAIHYFLLERYVAAWIVSLWIIRFFVAYYSTWKYWKYIFISLFCITTIVFFKDYFDLLILLAMSLSTIASFRKDDHSLRLLMMWWTLTTIFYNFIIFTPVWVLLESIFLWSNIVGYYRHYLRKK